MENNNELRKGIMRQTIEKGVISMTVHLDYNGEDILTELTSEIFTTYLDNKYVHNQLKTAEVVCRTANYLRVDIVEKGKQPVATGSLVEKLDKKTATKEEGELFQFVVSKYIKLLEELPDFEPQDTYNSYDEKITKFFNEKGFEDLDHEEKFIKTIFRYAANQGEAYAQSVVEQVYDFKLNKFIQPSFVRDIGILENNKPVFRVQEFFNNPKGSIGDGLNNDESKHIIDTLKFITPMAQKEVLINEAPTQRTKDFFSVFMDLREDFTNFYKQALEFHSSFVEKFLNNQFVLEVQEEPISETNIKEN